jgi:succinate dehydrogenase/fumarate reductase flavoprotein subunit
MASSSAAGALADSIASDWDVIVVGSGHAGSCAAIAAVEHGTPAARVLIVDRCPEAWVGGNGFFTAGAHRTAHGGLVDLLSLVSNTPERAEATIDVPPYTRGQFAADVFRMGGGRNNAQLVNALVDGSRDAVEWLHRRVGVDFTLSFNRQAYEVDGVQRFWGGMALSTRDGGKGLIEAHRAALAASGVQTWFETRAVELVRDEGRIVGIMIERGGERRVLRTRAVILAAGGFEASKEEREKHLGADWAEARVRPCFLRAARGEQPTLRRCAARRTTLATASAWPRPSARGCRATGKGATVRAGTRTHRRTRATAH